MDELGLSSFNNAQGILFRQGGSTALRRRMVETDIEHLAVNHFIIQNAKNPGAVGFVGKLLEAFASAGPQWCLLLSTVFEPYK